MALYVHPDLSIEYCLRLGEGGKFVPWGWRDSIKRDLGVLDLELCTGDGEIRIYSCVKEEGELRHCLNYAYLPVKNSLVILKIPSHLQMPVEFSVFELLDSHRKVLDRFNTKTLNGV